MDSVYANKEACCGCSACCNSCMHDAICMKPDEEGFLYPKIDQQRCVECGICRAVCPLLRQGSYKERTRPVFYVARHQSEEVLLRSTSGGAFTAISDVILRQGGIIYGADYDAEFQVLHQRAETAEQRDRMRISKYVQSDLTDVYLRIRQDLNDGRLVLFSGTPCQAAGLRGFMADSPLVDKLYICDLICHSIPSPLVWADYKRLLEQEAGGKINSVQFRSKKDGWSRGNSNKGFHFTTDKMSESREDNRFYQLFFKTGAITRLACSECRFTDVQRAADLTIADYWGIEKYSPEWFDSRGVSLIMTNSMKGAAILEQCRQDLEMEERPQEEALNEQKRLHEPAQLPAHRGLFWEEYRRFGLAYVIDKYK